MKRSFITSLLCLLSVTYCVAQNAKINLTVTDRTPFNGIIAVRDPLANFVLTPGAQPMVKLTNQAGSLALTVSQPHYINLTFAYTTTGQIKYGDDMINYSLFVSPGDDLTANIDLTKREKGITVTGKGSNNNQPGAASFTDIYSYGNLRKEKSAYVVINALSNEQKAVNKIFADYIAKNNPSAEFVATNRYNVMYYAVVKYLEIKTGALDVTHFTGPWQRVQDSLFAVAKLDNDDALISTNYTALITEFLLRKKEQLWTEVSQHPTAFYKEWYNTDTTAGKKLFADERTSLLQEKIIDKYFSRKTAEYLYAYLLKSNFQESNYHNIEKIYAQMAQKYPHSKYLSQFAEPVSNYLKKTQAKLNDNMVFVADNGSKLNTLAEVVALNKGRLVFVDMWGTWCGPCREEIEKNSAALKNYFKGKDVVFLYIANNDMNRGDEWKRLVAYYQMEGTHILANDKLTKDIMEKVKTHAFPTYFMISKDGKYAQTKNQYQFTLTSMEREISAAL